LETSSQSGGFFGKVSVGDTVSVCKLNGSIEKTMIAQLFTFHGLKQQPVSDAEAGDIIGLAGIEGIYIAACLKTLMDQAAVLTLTFSSLAVVAAIRRSCSA
jgi:predicted membrane GTPase involved in stress response